MLKRLISICAISAVDDSVQSRNLFIPFLYYAASNAIFVMFGAILVTYIEVTCPLVPHHSHSYVNAVNLFTPFKF